MNGMEMFLVRATAGAPSDANERIAEWAALRGGFVLMATGSGALILGMPPGAKDALEAHALVAFVGGVSFSDDGDPRARAALQRRFARNMLAQVGGLPSRGFSREVPPTT